MRVWNRLEFSLLMIGALLTMVTTVSIARFGGMRGPAWEGSVMSYALVPVACLGIAAIYWLTVRPVGATISSLLTAVEEYGKGNLKHRIDSRREDELGDLSRAFDGMSRELQQSLQKMTSEMAEREKLAFRDPLTGLPNRASILRSIQAAMDRGSGHRFALLFLDFDRFKLINDSLGHEVGDRLLQQIARRIQGALRHRDELVIPARLGGDEFVVLLDGLTEIEDATVVAERLLDVLSESYDLDGQTVCSTASIGVVTSDHEFESPSDMLRDADLAMYKSKAEGKARYTVFDQVLRKRIQDRLQLENEMRAGIARDEFVLQFQPIVSLDTGELVGAEALSRWSHPKRGLLSADSFLTVAEETGMIVPIGDRIIDDACRALSDWHRRRRAGDRLLSVRVNVSRLQLLLPDLVDIVRAAMQEHAIPPDCLHLEITEAVIMEDPEKAIEKLETLRQMGVKIDIDGFGTGYSSLSCLHEFPIDSLKIDRSFVANVTDAPEMAALLTAVVGLAEQLQLDVVAGGIEHPKQVAMLKDLGCRYGQGYLFAKPMSCSDFEHYMEPDLRSASTSA